LAKTAHRPASSRTQQPQAKIVGKKASIWAAAAVSKQVSVVLLITGRIMKTRKLNLSENFLSDGELHDFE
jgi:transposase